MTVLLSASTGPEWLATLGARLCAYTASERVRASTWRSRKTARAGAGLDASEGTPSVVLPAPVHAGMIHPADGAEGPGYPLRGFRMTCARSEPPYGFGCAGAASPGFASAGVSRRSILAFWRSLRTR